LAYFSSMTSMENCCGASVVRGLSSAMSIPDGGRNHEGAASLRHRTVNA
jgi:hypothetical protein